ncbi:hypothetical protein [Flavobacterium sp. JAS]|uniref:hypothetical protein n=1 Tax=Flavobacterium sp. JAS TaxID=2897329 RepID=UPI001E52CBCF|nr:hypothetical protein [Flavobacterium sp. JAS]MCD0471935.1 hypothetical protein [Flavobacterium sp. JAS]
MIKPLQLPLLIMILLFVSCQKKISDLEFEKNVMTEIFPSLIDSTCYDSRITFSKPPIYGQENCDLEGHIISIDSTKGTEEQKQKIEEWKRNQGEIEKDTSKIIIAFNPEIEKSNEDLKGYLEQYFKGAKSFYPIVEGDSTNIIDFKNIPIKHRFELRNISEFPKDKYEFWRKKYDFVFSGAVFFTRIQFDKDKKFGVLDGGFSCGRHCGNGFRIYIKKRGEKWVIDKIEETSVA